jgi:hypothetical protein
MRSEKKWYTMVYDATGAFEGDLLIGYDLIPMNDKINVSNSSFIIFIVSNSSYLSKNNTLHLNYGSNWP